MSYITAPIIVGDNVWIGANYIILRRTIIEDKCVIAASSSVKAYYTENSLVIQKKIR